MADKTLFSMQITQTQRDIIDYVKEIRFGGQCSTAFYLTQLAVEDALSILGLPAELSDELSDENVLQELKDKIRLEQISMIESIGEERYKKLVEKYNIDNKIQTSEKNDITYGVEI